MEEAYIRVRISSLRHLKDHREEEQPTNVASVSDSLLINFVWCMCINGRMRVFPELRNVGMRVIDSVYQIEGILNSK